MSASCRVVLWLLTEEESWREQWKWKRRGDPGERTVHWRSRRCRPVHTEDLPHRQPPTRSVKLNSSTLARHRNSTGASSQGISRLSQSWCQTPRRSDIDTMGRRAVDGMGRYSSRYFRWVLSEIHISWSGSGGSQAASRQRDQDVLGAWDHTHLFPSCYRDSRLVGHQATELVQRIGRCITDIPEDSRETAFLFQRLSMALQRGNKVSNFSYRHSAIAVIYTVFV